MKKKLLLWDIDGTILDFEKAEEAAIAECFSLFHLGVCREDMLRRYRHINQEYWQKLERREVNKQEMLIARFEDFFREYQLDISCAADFNQEYQLRLGDTIVFYDDAYHLLEKLKENYLLCAVTNGTKRAQEKKLTNANLYSLFDAVIISEEVGYEKPSPFFFEEVSRRFPFVSKEEMLIIGDSLSSDIEGGNNFGIETIWFNPKIEKKMKDISFTYEIHHLFEIFSILL